MSTKPKILFFSESGASFPIAWRLRKAGFDVAVYVEERRYRRCYGGILAYVEPIMVAELIKHADLIVRDGVPTVTDPEIHNIIEQTNKSVHLYTPLMDFKIIQNKFMMDGDLGPRVTCQGSVMKYEPESPGGTPTADAIYGMLSLMPTPWMEFCTKRGEELEFKDTFCASQRVTVPPYPYLNMECTPVEIESEIDRLPWFWGQDIARVNGKWVSAGADGLIGVVTGLGGTLNEAWGRCYQHIKSLKINGDIQYRKDGLKSARREIDRATLCPVS